MLLINVKLSTVLIRSGQLSLAQEYAQAALTEDDAPARVRVPALMNLAVVYRRKGQSLLSRLLVESVLALGESAPPVSRADAHTTSGTLAFEDGDLDRACDEWATALAIYRETGRRYGECKALGNLSQGNLERGRVSAARKFADLALAVARDAGLKRQEGWGLQHRAVIELKCGDRKAAHGLLRQSNEIARRLDARDLLFMNHFYQREIALQEGDEATASSLLRILRKMRSRIEDASPQVRACERKLEEDVG
jgi:tetratricopeptide (TPR) repeat protein